MGIQFDGHAPVSRARNAATLRRHFDALEPFVVVEPFVVGIDNY